MVRWHLNMSRTWHGMVNIHVLVTVFDSLWRVVKCGKSNMEADYHRVALAKRGDSQSQEREDKPVSVS